MLQGGKLFRKWVSFTVYTGSAQALTGSWQYVLLPTHNVPSRKVPSHKQLKIAKWSHRSVAKNTESLLTNIVAVWCVIHPTEKGIRESRILPVLKLFFLPSGVGACFWPAPSWHWAHWRGSYLEGSYLNEWGRSTEYLPRALPHLPITQGCAVLLESEPTFWTYLISEWNCPRRCWAAGTERPLLRAASGWKLLTGRTGSRAQGQPGHAAKLQLGIFRAVVCSKCAQPAPVHFLPPTSSWTGVVVKAKCISASYSQDFRSW